MRSYGQFCAMARGLDVIGDRWNLLIVRELLLRGPSRYAELQRGLPGIATNLLADRLRDLEANGVVTREGGLCSLTPRGRELEPVMRAIGRWGAPLLAETSPNEIFQSHWLALPLQELLADHAPKRPPQTLEVRTGDEPLSIEVGRGAVRIRAGRPDDPDAIIGGPVRLVLPVLAGRTPLARARVLFEGDPSVLRRLQPKAFTPRG
jgi:DNA-binding HxlR family transcriptional regulator